jgi:DNA primase
LANGFFSESQVSEVRGRSNIFEVVSDYVSLKKTGKNYKGLCPFHSEKTPSFMVNEEKQIYHCFGCGEGGDVFTFLMKVGHFTFPQALEELAKRYGIRLVPREFSPGQKKEMARREVLFQINQIALDYFHEILLRRKEGEQARQYLSKRGLDKGLWQEHQLGFSPDGWSGLFQHFREKKVDLEMAQELGLILPRKKEGWYDAFRGRVIFPIFDIHRRAVGFGGRILGEGQPKYLNSAESIIYHKGEVLYGLHVAKQAIQEQEGVILVEGYFDLLMLHQHGVKQSVATSGTALTAQHIRILKRYTSNFITAFDSDAAGIQANLRSLPLLLEEGIWGKTVLLPKGEDPDSFLRKGNLADFQKRVATAPPLFDFFLEQLARRYDARSLPGKVSIAEEGMGLLRRIPEGVRRSFYVKALAERVGLQETVLYEMVKAPSKEAHRDKDVQEPPARQSFPKSEEMMIHLMIRYPEVIPKISGEGILEEFENPFLKKMAQGLEAFYQKRGKLDLAEALGSFEEDLRRELSAFALQELGLGEGDREKTLKDCIQRIRERRFKQDRGALLRRIKEAEKNPGEKGLEALLWERQELVRKEGASGKTLGDRDEGRG